MSYFKLADSQQYDDTAIKADISALQTGKVDKSSLATVATTGSYNDLTDKPETSDYTVFMQDTQPLQDGLWIKGEEKDFMITPYLPKSESVPKLTLTLPSEREGTSAVTIGGKAYIFGGDYSNSCLPDILEFDPVANTCKKLFVSLPSKREGTSAVTIDGKAYIFGGYDGSNSKDISKFTPEWDLTDFDGYYIKTNQETGFLTKISSNEIVSIEKVYNNQIGNMESYSVINGKITKIE